MFFRVCKDINRYSVFLIIFISTISTVEYKIHGLRQTSSIHIHLLKDKEVIFKHAHYMIVMLIILTESREVLDFCIESNKNQRYMFQLICEYY